MLDMIVNGRNEFRRRRRRRRPQWWQIVGFLICLYYMYPSLLNIGHLLMQDVVQPALEIFVHSSSVQAVLSPESQEIGQGSITFTHLHDDLYGVEGSQALTTEEAQQKGQYLMAQQYKEFIPTSFGAYEITDSFGICTFGYSKDSVEKMQSVHAYCQSWCAANLPAIVPDGTTQSKAIRLCADWVADHMSYDHRALEDTELSGYYQNAAVGFSNGTGVCTTFTTMFNTMVSWLPFDPQTQVVSYTAAEPLHIDSVVAGNDTHAWSMLRLGTEWKQYDITFYDCDNGPRQIQYLDMQDYALRDGEHDMTFAFTTYYISQAE